MTARIRDILHWLSTLIDGFQPADGPPPRTLWPFIRWCLAGAWPVIVLASVLSGLAGVMEVGAAWLLGVLVDSTLAGTDGYFAESAGLIVLYVAFYLLLRPLFFGTSGVQRHRPAAEPVAPDPEPVAPLVAGPFGDLLRQRFRRPHRAEADADRDRAGQRGDGGHQRRRLRGGP
jgi:hypothetical protein